MVLHNSLQPLRDLDDTSTQFHDQLIDFLSGNEYRDIVPSLRGGDLAWLVEYLDTVSLQAVSSGSVLSVGVGPLWYLQFHRCPISGITTRTQADLWCEGGAPEIVHSLGFSSGIRV